MGKRFLNSEYSKYLIIFVASLVVGTVFANLSGKGNIAGWGICNNDYVKSYMKSSVNFAGQFKYIARKRTAALLIVILSSMTPFRKTFAKIICTYIGFSAGVVTAALTIQYGVKYFAVFPPAVLFHMFFYCYGVYGMFSREIQKNPAEILRVLRTVTAWLTGVFTESVMTYYVLPKVLLVW